MGTYEQLKAAITEAIKANGANEITGPVLQEVLLTMVSQLGFGAMYGGVAKLDTKPVTVDQKVFYFAVEKGTYVNFGGVQLVNASLGIISNNGGKWVLDEIPVSGGSAPVDPTTGGAEWYNIRIKYMKLDEQGDAKTPYISGCATVAEVQKARPYVSIENYDVPEKIFNNPDYRFALVRFKKNRCLWMLGEGVAAPKHWAVPMFAHKNARRESAMKYEMTCWPITQRKDVPFWVGEENYMPNLFKYPTNAEDLKFVYDGRKSRSAKFGVAIFKKATGEGTYGWSWQRVSNIAYITLRSFAVQGNNTAKLDIRYSI